MPNKAERTKRQRVGVFLLLVLVIGLIGYWAFVQFNTSNKPTEGNDTIIGYEQRKQQKVPSDASYTFKEKGYTVTLGTIRYVPQLSGAQPLYDHVLAVDMTVRNNLNEMNHITLSYFTLYPKGARVDAPVQYGNFRGYHDNVYPAIELDPYEVRDVTMYYDVDHQQVFEYRYMGREESVIATWTLEPKELN